jgi:hypothetical protein
MKKLLAFFTTMLLIAALNAQTIRYVKPTATGTGDGTSWANASSDLQAMLNTDYEVWVAAGTYKPTRDFLNNSNPSDVRTKTFRLYQGKIYGGFVGSETSLYQRNAPLNTTILTGDFNNNDIVSGEGASLSMINNDENAYNVVSCVEYAFNGTLDGFTILGGNENETLTTLGGGGLVCFSGGYVLLKNIVFKYNNAINKNGGAVFVNIGSSLRIENTVFYSNKTSSNGGAIYLTDNATLNNCIFLGNYATIKGGAIFLNASGTGIYSFVNNSTILQNACGSLSGGGGISLPMLLQGSVSASNCIIRDNINGNIEGNSGLGIYHISYCNIQGGYPGTANFDYNPSFVNPSDPDGFDNKWMTQDDGFRLNCNSTSLNVGDIGNAPRADILGNSRLGGTGVDLGAYELSNLITIPTNYDRLYVKKGANNNVTSNGKGSSWINAMSELSDAINTANNSPSNIITEIWVAAGTYTPAFDKFGNACPNNIKDKTFFLKSNVKIYGGFLGNEFDLVNRNWGLNQTVLSGDIGSLGIGDDNSFNVVTVPNGTINTELDGFVVEGGASNPSEDKFGGGINILNSSIKISNCVIQFNIAKDGGGIMFEGTSTDNIIFNNVVFANNIATSSGGGIFVLDGKANFNNCTFAKNTSYSTFGGGGLVTLSSLNSIYATNCIFWGNQAVNSTASKNSINSDFGSPPIVTYSDVELPVGNTFTGIGNKNINPNFIDINNYRGSDYKLMTNDDGLQLQSTSPCINTGDAASINNFNPENDIAKNSRYQGCRIDMGAYEYASSANDYTIVSTNTTVSYTQTGNLNNTIYTAACVIMAALQSNGTAPVTGTVNTKVWFQTTQPAQFVKRHYEITPTNNATNATGRVTLFFTQQEFTDFNTVNSLKLPISASDALGKANMRIEKRSGVSNNGTGLPDTYTGTITTIDPDDADIVWNTTANRWGISFDVMGFSGFFIKTKLGILPLNLLSFTAKKQNETAILNWQTAQEINTAKFIIERSADGNIFISIGNVVAKGSLNTSDYIFTDNGPLQGNNYYRIKMIDKDGKFTYTNIDVIKFENVNSITVYPNPATTIIMVDVSNLKLLGTDILQITNTLGQVVIQQKVKITNSINVAGLTKGVYYVKITGVDKGMSFIKE